MNVCIVCVNVRRKRNVHSDCACRMSNARHTHTHTHPDSSRSINMHMYSNRCWEREHIYPAVYDLDHWISVLMNNNRNRPSLFVFLGKRFETSIAHNRQQNSLFKCQTHHIARTHTHARQAWNLFAYDNDVYVLRSVSKTLCCFVSASVDAIHGGQMWADHRVIIMPLNLGIFLWFPFLFDLAIFFARYGCGSKPWPPTKRFH